MSKLLKKQVFATILTVLPVVFIVGMAEMVLRISGFGHATTPLIRTEINGSDYWVGNPDFTRLYFPAALKRLPAPNRAPAAKPPSTRRYMMVGGSAAAGDPDTDYSISRILEWMLATANPEIGYEVLNLAYTACNSHVAAEVVRQSKPYDLDGIIVFVGNNEVIGPFGPGTTLTESLPSPARRDLLIALRRTRLGQLGQSLRDRLTDHPSEQANWRGMQHFLEHRIDWQDPRLEQVYANYRANLEAMEREARRQDIPILLSNVPVNLLDQPPFADGGAPLPESIREAIPSYLAAAPEGLPVVDEILNRADRHPDSAWLAYLAGRLLHQRGQIAEADAYLKQARDLDQLRFRADSEINSAIVEQWKREGTNWIPVDAAAPLIADSPNKALGFPHFFEHVHFSFRANFVIAREMAAALLRHEEIDTGPLESMQWTEAALALAYTPYEVWLSLEEMERRFAQPPFTSISGFENLTSWMDVLRERLLARISKAEEKAHLNELYLGALRRRPDDDRLRVNYANFLMAFGKREAALPLMEQAYNRNPTDVEAAISWFTLCMESNRPAEAADAMARIERIYPEHPNLPELRNRLRKAGK